MNKDSHQQLPAPDALIFDMDGTMWDAIPSYCQVWNETYSQLGLDCPPVGYDDLLSLMGKPLAEIMADLTCGRVADENQFLKLLAENEDRMMPRLGGKLFPTVKETIETLHARGIKLFMLSNCSGRGLDNFLDFTGLRPYFTDSLSYGATGVDKDINMLRLREQYSLRRPLYVGDIQRDMDATHAAGMEFVWAAYGFGHAENPDFRIDSFCQLLDIV